MGVKAGVISIDIDAGTAKFLVDMEKSNVALQKFGQGGSAAGGHLVSSMAASSAAVRLFEGDLLHSTRAVERFIGLFPGVQKAITAAFPLVGGLAFAGLLGKLWAETVEFFRKMEQAPVNIANSFRALNQPLQLTNDELQLENDRVANAISKIEHKPGAGLKIALDEARVAADKLAESLNKDIETALKVTKENHVSLMGRLLGKAGTSDIEDEMKRFQQRIADISAKGNQRIQGATNAPGVGGVPLFSADASTAMKNAAQTRLNTELLAAYSDQIQRFKGLLKGAESPGSGSDSSARIEMLGDAIEGLSKQSTGIELRSAGADVKGKQATAEEKAEADRAAVEAARKATEELKKNDEDQLASLKAAHELSVGNVIQYWQKRLAAEHSNAERVHEIGITLGNLYQEQARVIQRVSEHGARLAEEQVNKARSRAKELEDLVQEAETLNEKIGVGGTEPREQAKKLSDFDAAAKANTAEAGIEKQKLEAERAYGLQVSHTGSQQIAFMQALAVLESQQMAVKEAKLEADLEAAKAEGDVVKIKQAQAALDKQLLDDANARIAVQTKIDEKMEEQSFGKQLGAIGQQGVASLSGAMAKGIIDGKGIGKDIRDSLKGIGKEMLGSVFDKAISEMVVAITGQTIATNIQTVATQLNTWFLAARMALFGFAEGGRPAAGVPYLVGEHGPELRVDDAPGSIIPNHMLGNYASSRQAPHGPSPGSNRSYGGHTFNVTQHVYESLDAMETARQITNGMKTLIPSAAPYSS